MEVLSEPRRRAIGLRWREVVADHVKESKTTDPRAASIDWFGWFFAEVAKSPFLSGRAKDWRANIDWLMNPRNFVKVTEGYYQREKA